ncbi:tripartite tricarboxylate transporter TctB family protein [Azospirillum melinis]
MPRNRTRIDGKNLQAGVLFAGAGAGFAAGASRYPLGTAAHMGPGWFPLVLGLLLVALGALVALTGVSTAARPAAGQPATSQPPTSKPDDAASAVGWRPLLHVTLSITAFALLIEPAGLVAASLALVLLSASGGWEFRWTEATILAGSLAALVVGLFAYALHIPINVWPINVWPA